MESMEPEGDDSSSEDVNMGVVMEDKAGGGGVEDDGISLISEDSSISDLDLNDEDGFDEDDEQLAPGSNSSSGGGASTILTANNIGGNGTPPTTTITNNNGMTDTDTMMEDDDMEVLGEDMGDSISEKSYDSDEDCGYSDELEEIDALLDEGLPEDFRRTPNPKKRKLNLGGKTTGDDMNSEVQQNGERADNETEFNLKEITVLVEKGKNTLEVLPGGWIEVRHTSGMPLYLHRKSRICTLSRPYFLGPGSARRHSIPLSAIPCLAYRKALDREKMQEEAHKNASICELDEIKPAAEEPETNEDSCTTENINNEAEPLQGTKAGTKRTLPCAKVETVRQNNSLYSVEPGDVRKYCEALFQFKNVRCKRFKTWSARRKHNKELKRLQLQRPTLPEGVKLITFPIHNSGKDGGKSTKEYVMNPQGKSSVCILHEYVQHAMRQQPTYAFRELENAATPYSAQVIIGALKYGTGYGSSKKQAKAEAAKATIELFIPQMKDQLDGSKTPKNKELDHTTYFDQVEMDDTRITQMCNSVSEPSPYTLLLTCLQRNFGLVGSSSVKFEMIASNNQANKFRMETGEYSVEVTASNKREGKQLASQALLAKIHPHILNFGAFLRLYGNGSIKSVKEKKQEEQQITTLQSKASANSPNYAILDKLRKEMKKLKEQEAKYPIVSIEHELGLL